MGNEHSSSDKSGFICGGSSSGSTPRKDRKTDTTAKKQGKSTIKSKTTYVNY